MDTHIGQCSICGGDVYGYRGAWTSVTPPPPARCRSCGAVEAAAFPVIPMRPMRKPDYYCIQGSTIYAGFSGPSGFGDSR